MAVTNLLEQTFFVTRESVRTRNIVNLTESLDNLPDFHRLPSFHVYSVALHTFLTRHLGQALSESSLIEKYQDARTVMFWRHAPNDFCSPWTFNTTCVKCRIPYKASQMPFQKKLYEMQRGKHEGICINSMWYIFMCSSSIKRKRAPTSRCPHPLQKKQNKKNQLLQKKKGKRKTLREK